MQTIIAEGGYRLRAFVLALRGKTRQVALPSPESIGQVPYVVEFGPHAFLVKVDETCVVVLEGTLEEVKFFQDRVPRAQQIRDIAQQIETSSVCLEATHGRDYLK